MNSPFETTGNFELDSLQRKKPLGEKEQFDAALRWVEHDLKNVVTVIRLGESDATIDGYHVGFDERDRSWGVWENDDDFLCVDDDLGPVDAVACALSYAVPAAMESAIGQIN